MKEYKKVILLRIYILYFVMLLFGAGILVRAFYIHFTEGEQLKAKADQQSLKFFSIDANRGNIYSSEGYLLATSVPVFDIRMDVASPLISDEDFYNKIDSLSLMLSRLFRDKKAWQYKSNLVAERKAGNRYYLLKKNVRYVQLKKMREFPILRRGTYRGGLIVEPGNKREKPFKLLAERTIGYENEAEGIFVGIEGAYNSYLKGTKGKQLKRKIGNNDWKPVRDENDIEPVNGKDVVTGIDLNIQDVAEDALMRHLKEHQADWGCAVLMEVKTGKIKAIANLTVDTVSNTYREVYNYAIGHSMEPGSTFKLASIISLLENDRIDLKDTIDIGNGIARYHNLEIKDVHPIRDGRITIREAFESSSNAGISKIIYKNFSSEPMEFIDMLYDMSLNEKLGIPLQGEGSPFIKNTENESWSRVSLPFMSIGYELKMTPLQLLAFYNAIANDGKKVKPVFVTHVTKTGEVVKTFETEVLNKSICSSSTIEKVRSLLEGVVERGTATRLRNPYYKIAGKTGTAQIANRNQGYDKVNYNASFVGYFPADRPEYSCIVVVSRPKTGRYYASSVAVPVFREIADKVYSTNLDIQPLFAGIESEAKLPVYDIGNISDFEEIYESLQLPIDSASSFHEWVVSLEGENNIKLGARFIKENTIPNVVGMKARDAVYLLESLGLKTNMTGRGTVKKQSLPAGTLIKHGEVIRLSLST